LRRTIGRNWQRRIRGSKISLIKKNYEIWIGRNMWDWFIVVNGIYLCYFIIYLGNFILVCESVIWEWKWRINCYKIIKDTTITTEKEIIVTNDSNCQIFFFHHHWEENYQSLIFLVILIKI
jgi:hypothetical protein